MAKLGKGGAMLCFQFVGGVQIGENECGRKRVWWIGGGVVGVVTVVAERRRRTEGTIGRGACSQLARVEVRGVLIQKRERGTEKEERKKEVKNKVSIHKEM